MSCDDQTRRLTIILRTAISQIKDHAKLLNSFSLMEHNGARKIFSFLGFGNQSTLVLRHAAEEARHAYYFRQQIECLGIGSSDSFCESELLAPRSSKQYIRRLDVDVCKTLKRNGRLAGPNGAYLSYGWTTLLIEYRASSVYRIYQGLLDSVRSLVSVRSIIAEEDRHLQETEGLLKRFYEGGFRSELETLQMKEERLFMRWLHEAEIGLNIASIDSRK